ncbi:MAG: (d)CMP kinase [Parvularculaceae bacterium]
MTVRPSPAVRPKPVIAIDGPAASGKGTLARRLARHYGFAHLATGVLYRGVAWLTLRGGRDPADAAAAAATAEAFSLDQVDDADLRAPDVGPAASVVAANPAVRAALLAFQRRFADDPPDGAAGAVLDGRDIATVVRPDATAKLYVTASAPVRARRRWLEERAGRPDLTEAMVLADVEARDARDAGRADAPLKKADDARLLDTTHLTIDAAFEAARVIVDDALDAASADGVPR